jgi:four helix bundle protein
MKIERFEDLDCWKSARELVKLVYSLSSAEGINKDYGLRDQIRRAATSVMANIAEGFSTRSKMEFIRFLDYSARSAAEVQSHLYATLDLDYIEKKEFETAYKKAQDCINLCKGFIRYLRRRK